MRDYVWRLHPSGQWQKVTRVPLATMPTASTSGTTAQVRWVQVGSYLRVLASGPVVRHA